MSGESLFGPETPLNRIKHHIFSHSTPMPMSSPSFPSDLSGIASRSSAEERKAMAPIKETPEEDNVIVLDEDEDEQETLLSNSNLEPVKGVNIHDYETLKEDEFLNDSIIQFYLDWLTDEYMSSRDDVYVFSTHFYTKLMTLPKQPISECGPRSRACMAHQQVSKWTKNVDIFSKRILVFPICEEYHWYAIVAVNVGNINAPKVDQVIKGKPYLLILDSMAEEHPKAVSALRNYLSTEYREKKSRNSVVIYSKEKMSEIYPELPLQQNHCDCGVFLLHYIELIFQNPKKFYFSHNVSNLRKWFSQDEIKNKRSDIAGLLQRLADQNGKPGHQYPDMFPRRTKRRLINTMDQGNGDKVSSADVSDNDAVINPDSASRKRRSSRQKEISFTLFDSPTTFAESGDDKEKKKKRRKSRKRNERDIANLEKQLQIRTESRSSKRRKKKKKRSNKSSSSDEEDGQLSDRTRSSESSTPPRTSSRTRIKSKGFSDSTNPLRVFGSSEKKLSIFPGPATVYDDFDSDDEKPILAPRKFKINRPKL